MVLHVNFAALPQSIRNQWKHMLERTKAVKQSNANCVNTSHYPRHATSPTLEQITLRANLSINCTSVPSVSTPQGPALPLKVTKGLIVLTTNTNANTVHILQFFITLFVATCQRTTPMKTTMW